MVNTCMDITYCEYFCKRVYDTLLRELFTVETTTAINVHVSTFHSEIISVSDTATVTSTPHNRLCLLGVVSSCTWIFSWTNINTN